MTNKKTILSLLIIAITLLVTACSDEVSIIGDQELYEKTYLSGIDREALPIVKIYLAPGKTPWDHTLKDTTRLVESRGRIKYDPEDTQKILVVDFSGEIYAVMAKLNQLNTSRAADSLLWAYVVDGYLVNPEYQYSSGREIEVYDPKTTNVEGLLKDLKDGQPMRVIRERYGY